MRRRLVLLLALVLLFQFNWFAAASACTHEPGPGVHHFGHHTHDHKPGWSKAGERLPGGGTLGDGDDCPVCHLGCATIAPSLAAVRADRPAIVHAPAPPPLRLLAWGDPPERPRWPAAS